MTNADREMYKYIANHSKPNIHQDLQELMSNSFYNAHIHSEQINNFVDSIKNQINLQADSAGKTKVVYNDNVKITDKRIANIFLQSFIPVLQKTISDNAELMSIKDTRDAIINALLDFTQKSVIKLQEN
ncbi:MAG: hypothetical protein HRT47_05320 [Candidatus Caenarcaniphilales bacterium]|nr:hypothetical protein [Candidatus Caenarcaniphilales bacterium]